MSIPIFMHDREDWAYFHFNPRMKGIELRERGDGLSELVLVRDPEVDKYHSAWYTFPDDEEYSMQDCYAKHPTKPNYWLFMGRADDIIVLSNGETFNPKTMEDTIREDPNVREVLVLGQSRFEIAALIEQHNESYSSSSPSPDGLKRLFEYIAKANAEAPGHAQLSEDRILFTKPNKPLLRAGKGTVLRSAALKAFESEIEELYTSGSEQDTKSLLKMDAQDEHSLTDWLLHVFRSAIHVEGLTVDDDLFDAGLDSLEVMKLVRQLKVAFSNSKSIEVPATLVTPSAIYTNPTVSQLSRTLYCTGSKETDITNGVEGDHVPSMEDMYEKYAHDLPQKAYRTTKSTDDEFTVLLTGSTGSLGSYMLDSLISESAVARIYCLNRTINGEAKQKEVNAARHLSTSWGEKVKFLHVDLSKDHFDLGQVEYDELISSVSFIIHSQWSVDFNQSLNSFEPHIRGVRHLVDFSNESTMDAPILYTSSISTIGRWDVHHSGQRVPEGPTHDYSLPLNMGYGESKYVCEQLLETARDKSGVSAAICRVGQIAGPVEKLGIWNTQEWFPSIIASSKYLGLLPDSFGAHDDITWIPVDTLANIIVELMLSHSHTCGPSRADAWSAFHNLINPNSASWSSLLPVVKDRLGKDVEVVSYASWLKALQESVDRVEDIKSNPAVKLLAFFESLQEGSAMPEMETKQTVKASETMAALGPVTADWMEKWMQQWGL
ncbi:hypothetical protein MMC18_008084 [Xylographa bjoerkii]|nr:hypothetical protein [Xylographa bjoerkii]